MIVLGGGGTSDSIFATFCFGRIGCESPLSLSPWADHYSFSIVPTHLLRVSAGEFVLQAFT